MIFDKEYDDSLWLMANKDKKVSSDLIYFFKSFPQEVLNVVQELLKEYKQNVNNCKSLEDLEEFEKKFSGSYKEECGLLYNYRIDLLGSIEISESYVDEDGVVPIRCMILYPFRRNDFEDKENYRKMMVGTLAAGFSYCDDKMYVIDKLSTNVEIKKTIFGDILCCYGYMTDNKRLYHRINVKDIPEDYSVEEILNSDVAKKLVRKKKSN